MMQLATLGEGTPGSSYVSSGVTQLLFRALGALTLISLLAVGCTIKSEEEVEEEKEREEAQQVLGQVNDETIRIEDFSATLESLPTFLKEPIKGKTAILRFVGDMVRFNVLVSKAREEGFTKAPEVQVETKKALRNALHEDHLSKHPPVIDEEAIKTRCEEDPSIVEVFKPRPFELIHLHDPGRGQRAALVFELYSAAAWLDGTREERFAKLAARISDERGSTTRLEASPGDTFLPREVIEAILSAPNEGSHIGRLVAEDDTYLFLAYEAPAPDPPSVDICMIVERQRALERETASEIRSFEQSLVQEAKIDILDPALQGALEHLRENKPIE